MVRSRVPDNEKAAELVKELSGKAFKEIASSRLMLSMMISVYVSNGYKLISNRSELYEKALRTLMGRTDKHRAGLGQASQTELFEHLQKLASASHGREGERCIFTAAQASEWADPDGWAAIEGAARGSAPRHSMAACVAAARPDDGRPRLPGPAAAGDRKSGG